MADFRDLTSDEHSAMEMGYVDAVAIARCLCGASGFFIDGENDTACTACRRVYRVVIQVRETQEAADGSDS